MITVHGRLLASFFDTLAGPVPVTGRVLFTPNFSSEQSADGVHLPSRLSVELDSGGSFEARLLTGDWSWRVEVIAKDQTGRTLTVPCFNFLPEPGVDRVNFAEIVPLVDPVTSTPMLRGEDGVGVEAITTEGGELIFTLTDGSETRIPVPQGAPAPADKLVIYTGGSFHLGEAEDGRMVGVLVQASGTIAEQEVSPGQVWVFIADGGAWSGYLAGGTVPPAQPITSPAVTISQVTDKSARISWSPVTAATSYEGRVSGGAIQTVSTPWDITGLAMLTSYTAEVRAVGADGSKSGWGAVAFSTVEPPVIPLAFHKATVAGYNFPADGSLVISTTSAPDDTATATSFNNTNSGARIKETLVGQGFVEFTASGAEGAQYRAFLHSNTTSAAPIGILVTPSGQLNLGGGTYAGGADSKSTLAAGGRFRLGRSADAYYIDQKQGDAWVRLGAQPVGESFPLRFQANNWGGTSSFKITSVAGAGWS